MPDQGLAGRHTHPIFDTHITKEIETRFRGWVKAEVEEARPKTAEQHLKTVLARSEKMPRR
jgi:hypothetical protein